MNVVWLYLRKYLKIAHDINFILYLCDRNKTEFQKINYQMKHKFPNEQYKGLFTLYRDLWLDERSLSRYIKMVKWLLVLIKYVRMAFMNSNHVLSQSKGVLKN